ncbi:MAG: hypothetical protein L0Z51_09115 [Candidatus Latescibacteria bacterium]|nr:hypothetical protein [Candidatus Latescibacterota bacterium]
MKISVLAFVVLMLSFAVSDGDALFPAALTLEAGYGIGPPPPFPWQMHHAIGAPLIMAGRVSALGRPFDDIALPGSYELTYVFECARCVSADVCDGPPCTGGGDCGRFDDGNFTVYLDTTPDAVFTDLATFRDGDVVLLGLVSYTFVFDDDPHELCPMLDDVADIDVFFHFVGGLWFDRVSNDEDGLAGHGRCEMEAEVPAPLQSLGYVIRVDGVVDIDGPVPVTSTTWGAVKALYR